MFSKLSITAILSMSAMLSGIASAAPTAETSDVVIGDIPANATAGTPAYYFKGIHHDNQTGQDLALYNPDQAMSQDDAFAQYLKSAGESSSSESELDKRGAYSPCSTSQAGLISIGCGSGYSLKPYVTYTSQTTSVNQISNLIGHAFRNQRDYYSPRSICISSDAYTVCVSWSYYEKGGLTYTQTHSLASYAVYTCASADKSAEASLDTTINGQIYVCLSDRATGCGAVSLC